MCMLTKNQFDILYLLFRKVISDKSQIVDKLELPIDDVSEILMYFEKNNYIKDYLLTTKGKKILDFYKVDNAVIMAAGMSSRLAPLSYERPKGLLKVKGEILIERQIKQLQEVGVKDIILVVGYMKEQFFYLEDKYNVKIIINEDYYRYNNTSTLNLVKKNLKNTYICSSDNYFANNVFDSHVYNAYYAAVWNAGSTKEYCLTMDETNKITRVDIGGKDALIMLGHAYFTKNFSNRFRQILSKEFASDRVKEMLWEDLYIEHIDQLDLFIKKYAENEIFEFDTIDDLKNFDYEFLENTSSDIIDNICTILKCKKTDITEFTPIKKGMTNFSFSFVVFGKKYVYRHPGIGTEQIINRQSEYFAQNVAAKLGIDTTLIYMDPNKGWKISKYMEGEIEFDYHNEADVKKILKLIKKLHDECIQSKWKFDFWQESENYIALARQGGRNIFNSFNGLENLRERIHVLYNYVEGDNIPKRLCHIDCFSTNFLTNGNEMCLIDWEYSGNSDPASDLGTMICSSDYNEDEVYRTLEFYFDRKLTNEETRHYLAYIAIAGYCWFAWALYKESIGNVTGEYLYIWYKYAKKYSEIALELYQIVNKSN